MCQAPSKNPKKMWTESLTSRRRRLGIREVLVVKVKWSLTGREKEAIRSMVLRHQARLELDLAASTRISPRCSGGLS